MEKWKIIIVLISVVLASCFHDLDEAGAVHSEYNANERFEMSQQWNNTHPFQVILLPDSAYSVLFCGDTHIGTYAKFSQVLDAAKSPSAAALVVAGDITRGHPESYDTLETLMNSIDSVNWFFTAGNHDLYFGGWDEYYPRFGSSAYYFIVSTPAGNDLFLILDSGSGTLGNLQLDWLSETLESFGSSARHITLVTHLNVFKDGMGLTSGLPMEEVNVLLDLCAQYEINYVISGHDHTRYESELGPTRYIIMDQCHDEEENSSYLEIKYDNSSCVHEFHNIE
ncbi:3',5'-cyclic adenosine monophosphate phosphodiesterase CpdA [bioreactor metagenome]|uniref:3',5'-cyclic adenosine monophosphate phosphodiesterase CpdA n=1 Tax=bioreactor metagenome TaxID=1076179 RepID=A0A644VRL9_9ZZZZ